MRTSTLVAAFVGVGQDSQLVVAEADEGAVCKDGPDLLGQPNRSSGSALIAGHQEQPEVAPRLGPGRCDRDFQHGLEELAPVGERLAVQHALLCRRLVGALELLARLGQPLLSVLALERHLEGNGQAFGDQADGRIVGFADGRVDR